MYIIHEYISIITRENSGTILTKKNKINTEVDLLVVRAYV